MYVLFLHAYTEVTDGGPWFIVSSKGLLVKLVPKLYYNSNKLHCLQFNTKR